MWHRMVIGLTGLLLVAGSTCAAATGPLTISLQYRASDAGTSSVQAVMKGDLAVLVTDQREKKDAIGQNTEEAAPRLVLTKDDPAAFVRDVAVQQLRARGATIAKPDAKARRKIVLQLNNFYCTESNLYRSAVQFKAEVLDEKGKVLWEGVVNGASKQWGKSYNAENYQESLSNATSDALTSMLNDPGFGATLK